MTTPLTDEQVRSIRMDADIGRRLRSLVSERYSYDSIADRHGIDRGVVYRIAGGLSRVKVLDHQLSEEDIDRELARIFRERVCVHELAYKNIDRQVAEIFEGDG